MSSRWDTDDGEHVRRRGAHATEPHQADVHALQSNPVPFHDVLLFLVVVVLAVL